MKEARYSKSEASYAKENRLRIQKNPGLTRLSLLLFEIYASKVVAISKSEIKK